MENLTSLGSVIQKIAQDHGEKALLDSHFTLAVFMDLAPNLKKERELLRSFLLCNGAEKIIQIKNSSFNDQKRCMEALVKSMEDDQWVATGAARYACSEFYRGITNKEWIFETPKAEPPRVQQPHNTGSYTPPAGPNNGSPAKSNIIKWIIPAVIVLALVFLFKGCFGNGNDSQNDRQEHPSNNQDTSNYQDTTTNWDQPVDTYQTEHEEPVINTLPIATVTDNPLTVNGIFVGETKTIYEEDTVVFTGNLASDDARDVYSYTAPRDGRYGFEVLNISANDSVRLMVFDPSGERLLDNWSGSGYVNMKAGETYEIRVCQDDGYPTYTLNLYVQKPTVDLSTITTVYDQIAFEDQKNVYTFTAPITGRYHFELSEYMNGVGFRMMMWDKLENSVMDSWGESATVDLEAGETYDFQIRQDEDFGSYILSIGFQKETIDITGVTVVYDSIEYTDQRNVYTFTAPATGRYHFELSEYKSGVGFRMLMWDRLDNNIMDSWGESASVDLDAGETYSFQIRQDEGFHSYKLSIGSQKEPVDITGYDIITDSVTFEDQKNIYYFTPNETGKYTFVLTDHDASCSFRLMAWDNYENNIMDTYSDDGTITLESGITYEIQVRQYEGVGAYALYVEKEQ